MSLFRPCSLCEKRAKGANANVTTAWYDVEGTRHAWRQYICVGCFAQTIAPLEVAAEDESLRCPVCGADASDDLDPTYYTLFIPGSGQHNLELPTDPACAAILRVRGQKNAIELENRPIEGLGPSPSISLTSAWDELGLGRRVP